MSEFGAKTSTPEVYPMKPYYTYGCMPLSPNVISEKSEEASRVRSYDFRRLSDSTVNFNTVGLTMRQML